MKVFSRQVNHLLNALIDHKMHGHKTLKHTPQRWSGRSFPELARNRLGRLFERLSKLPLTQVVDE